MDASYNLALMTAGGAACALALGAGAKGLIDDWRRRTGIRHRRRESHQAFCQQIQTESQRALTRLNKALAWQGTRELRVAAVVDECDDIRSFYFALPDGRPLPSFLPGQYLTLHLPCKQHGKPVVRCYSLSDRPQEEYYRCSIKRQGPPSGSSDVPPGVGSNFLHDHVQVDDLVLCEAPRGPFYLMPTGQEPVVLIGGGIGLTPMVSMINTIAQNTPNREVYLFAGVRNRREFPFREHLRELAQELPGLKLYVAYSKPESRDVQYNDYHHNGRVTLEYLREVLPSANFPFYLCGPPAMMQSLAPSLLEWGVPDDRIHFEAFGPASVRLPNQKNPAAEAIGEHVRFERQQQEYVWEAGVENLLDLANKHNTPIESGCRAGNCGQCAVKVLSGKTTTLRTPGATVPEGHCLACVSVPEGSVVLDV